MNSSKTNSSLRSFIDSVLKWIQYISNTLSVLALIAVAVVVLYQIFARYALPKVPVWTEELSRYLFIFSIVFCSGSAIISRRHITLDLFRSRLSEKTRKIYDLTIYLIITAFGIFLLKFSWKYMSVGNYQTSPALGIKMSWIFASTLIFFSIITACSVLMSIKTVSLLFDKGEE